MAESSRAIHVGSRVCVRDQDGETAFHIVEPAEADAIAERVSTDSPLGHALIGRSVGDVVHYRAPGGVFAVTVVEVG